jgi:hypothetical protein
MATAKKSPAKKVAVKAPVKAPVKAAPKAEQKFAMPVEVQEWIERANSTIQHLRGQVETLKKENSDLKAYRKFAENRILRSDHE